MKIIALIVFVLLAGCMGPLEKQAHEDMKDYRAMRDYKQSHPEAPQAYSTAPMTEQERQTTSSKDKDMAVCRYEATKATASSQRGYTVYSTIFNDVGDTFRQAELITLCMKSKGWVG